MDEGKVAFDIDGEEETALFPIEWIASAKLVLTDALIEASLKAGAKAGEAPGADNDNEQETFHGDHQ